MPVRSPSAAELLEVWEAGAALSHPRRALLLLEVVDTDFGGEAISGVPVGRCDAELLRLRAKLFGPRLVAVVPCSDCGEPLESSILVNDLILPDEVSERSTQVRRGGYEIATRLPTIGDLAALRASGLDASSRSMLLTRCIVTARDGRGELVDPDRLPGPILDAIETWMASADPQADLRLDLTCPSCSHRWQASFDAAAFLWSELHAWATRTLRDVHTLARAYGWSEEEVLRLSPTRRRLYLEMCRS
jgi:hypothetical protein